MDNHSIQLITVTVGVILVLSGLYFCFTKLKTLHSLQIQTQKHVMYQQNIIEKHNNILQTLTIGQQVPSQNVIPPFTETTLPTTTIPPLTETTIPVEPEPPKAPEPKPNPMANILPMLSTIMTMMNQDDEGSPSDVHSESLSEDMELEEDDDKKTEMVQEIEKELNELKSETANPIEKLEGRIDDIEEETVVSPVS